jgi:hypothetical protein
VHLGDENPIDVAGKGSVSIQGKLPYGKVSCLVLRNILYVPDLGHSNLLSWRAIKNAGNFHLLEMKKNIFVRKKNRDNVLWAKE